MCEKSQLIGILVFSNVVRVEFSTVKYSTGDNATNANCQNADIREVSIGLV